MSKRPYKRNSPVAKALKNEAAIVGKPLEYVEHYETSDGKVLVVIFKLPPLPVGRGNHGTVRHIVETRMAIYIRGCPAGRANVESVFEDHSPMHIAEVTEDG